MTKVIDPINAQWNTFTNAAGLYNNGSLSSKVIRRAAKELMDNGGDIAQFIGNGGDVKELTISDLIIGRNAMTEAAIVENPKVKISYRPLSVIYDQGPEGDPLLWFLSTLAKTANND